MSTDCAFLVTDLKIGNIVIAVIDLRCPYCLIIFWFNFGFDDLLNTTFLS